MSVKRNFIYNFLYQLLTIIIPIITMPYVSRVLGPEGVGINTFTNAYVQYFILLGSLGLSTYSNRQIAYVRNNGMKLKETLSELAVLRIITLGISMALYILVFLVINQTNRLIYAIQGLNLLAAAVDVTWYFMGLENFKIIAQRNMTVKLVGTALIFLLIKNKNQVWLYILILSATQLFSQLILWTRIIKSVSFKYIKRANLFSHLIFSLRLLIPQLAIQVYTLFDKTLLGYLKGDVQVGIYDNSQKIIIVALSLLTSLSTVMMPHMANTFANGDIERFKENLKKSFSFISLLSIPMAFGIVGIVNNLIPWFLGSRFSHAKILLYIETWMIIPIAWSNVLGIQVLVPMKKERYYSISVIAAAVTDIVLNLIFIPKHGYDAAAFSTVVAECVCTATQLYYLRNFINIKSLFQGLYRNIIGSVTMLTIIMMADRFLKPAIITTFIEITIGGLTYIIIMWLFKDETFKIALDNIRIPKLQTFLMAKKNAYKR